MRKYLVAALKKSFIQTSVSSMLYFSSPSGDGEAMRANDLKTLCRLLNMLTLGQTYFVRARKV